MNRIEQANNILKQIEEANHSAYLVGGCVRDMLLQSQINDIDICTSALPETVLNIFKDYNIIPTGLKHGTVTLFINNNSYDITTYRIEDNYNDFRHPDFVKFVSNIDEDLSRRDFTINAIAQDRFGKIHDPFNGQDDIKNHIIRAVGDPNKRFQEDPLRIMRAIRFSAKLGFNIETNTKKAMQNYAHLLTKISYERIRDELKQILIYDPEKIQLMQELGILKVILPEVTNLYLCKQHNKWHYTDAMHHTFDALKYSKKFNYLSDTKKFYFRMALLLHDIGKFDTESIGDDGYQHYFNHPEYSYKRSINILKKFKFSNKEMNIILKLIRYHDFNLLPKRKSLYKVITEYGFSLYEFKLLGYLKECDLAAHVHQKNDQRLNNYFKILKMYKQKSKTDSIFTPENLAINGEDIMRILNLKPSSLIGKIKNELFNLVFYKPSLNKKEFLEQYIIETYKECDKN